MSEKYNGWTNRETWLVNLWFGDSWGCEADVDYTMDIIQEDIDNIPTYLQDFICSGLINWEELKDHVREGMEVI